MLKVFEARPEFRCELENLTPRAQLLCSSPLADLVPFVYSKENLGSTELDARYAADYEAKPFEHNDPNFREVQAGRANL